MISKCIFVMAIVAQIYGQVNGCGCANVGSTISTRNIITRGKYPIALQHTGPGVDNRIPVSSSHVQTPVEIKPTVRLPYEIPLQKTVAHSCTCYKTIMRPKVHNQFITVPSVQRYVETVHRPVVENIHYEGVPVNDADSVVGGRTLALGTVVGDSLVRVAPVSALQVGAPVSAVQVAAPVSALQVAAPVSAVQVAAPVSAVQVAAPVSTVQVASPVSTVQVATPVAVAPVQVRGTLNSCGSVF